MSDFILKIKDLGNELKLKELEINNLKLQLKAKDEIIDILKQTKETKQFEESKQLLPKQLSSKQLIEKLNKDRFETLTIYEFINTVIYNENNKYFQIIKYNKFANNKDKSLKYFNKNNFEAIIPKTSNGLFDFSSFTNLVINIFCSIIEKTDKNLCPIYCNDMHRNIFYIKFDEGWKKASDEEIKTIIYYIIKKIDIAANNADFNVCKLYKYSNDLYNQIYSKAIKNDEVFDLKHDIIKSIICIETTNEIKDIIEKHLKAELSKITGDKVIKFNPLKNEIIKPIELETDEDNNYCSDDY